MGTPGHYAAGLSERPRPPRDCDRRRPLIRQLRPRREASRYRLPAAAPAKLVGLAALPVYNPLSGFSSSPRP
jgi:hypothetical protein